MKTVDSTPDERPALRTNLPAEPRLSAVDAAATLSSLPLALGLLSSAIVITGLYFGRDILVPLALAFFLGFVLNPAVVRLKRAGLPRALAVVLVVSLSLAAVGGAVFLLGSQVRTLSAQLPIYQSNIRAKVRSFQSSLAGAGMFDGAVTTIDAVKKEVEAESDSKAVVREQRPEAQRVRIEQAAQSPIEKAIKWLSAIGGPLTNAGIILVFVFLVLLDRQDLRDRLLRLLGGNLHRTTDAMDEAGARIGKYLTMQVLVNASYGVPMALGLWLIGIPGALLWGALASVMRFVPYIGPMISALFPLALAFAVDPGWNMLLWTVGLIVLLELLSNNLVEPWLYGQSTGLSAMSLMVAATFWTLLWGPIGLVMSTPLTVCLLVIGRHLPQLRFFHVLLGSQPVLDAATRIYQRLLAGDFEEAIELSVEHSEVDGAPAFYAKVGIPVLRIACADHDRVASAEHRHRVVVGMDRVMNELASAHEGPQRAARSQVVCLGGKWEVDLLAARMLAHGLGLSGILARAAAADAEMAMFIATLDLGGARIVCLSHFSPDPQSRVRYLARHLRRRWSDLHIVAVLWNAPSELLDAGQSKTLGVDAVATSYEEALLRVRHHLDAQLQQDFLPAPIPPADLARIRALRSSGALHVDVRRHFDLAAKRAAEVFDAPLGMVTLIDEANQLVCGASGALPPGSGHGTPADGDAFNIAREISLCGHVVASEHSLVVEDIARDPRFANNPALAAQGVRFYAGAPFRDAAGHVYGSLCILDRVPRTFGEREIRLLELMADELRHALPPVPEQPVDVSTAAAQPASAIVGQLVPN